MNKNYNELPHEVYQRLLGGVEAFLYVADPNTDEILFMNEKMRRAFGIGVEDGEKRFCWEFFGYRDSSCAPCPALRLKHSPLTTITWDMHCPRLGRYMRVSVRRIEWVSGIQANIFHAIDVTETKRAEESLEQRLSQQELMATIAKNFLESGDIYDQIGEVLKAAGEFMHVSRAVLAHYNAATGMLSFPRVWYNEERNPPRLKEGKNVLLKNIAPMYDAIMVRRHTVVVVDNVNEDPGFAPVFNIMDMHAFITVPVYIEGCFWGMFGFQECEKPRKWSASDIQMVRMIGSVVAGAARRKAAEEKLGKMHSIANSSPEMILYINNKGNVEFCNKSILKALQVTESEMMAEGGLSCLGEGSYKFFKEKIFPRVLNEGDMEFQHKMYRADGEEFITNCSFFRTDLTPPGIGLIASDITEQNRMEQEVIAAKEQAERASRAKSDFLSRMSHEMRTPMNAIIGMANIARSSHDMEKMLYCIGKIDDASNHLLGVINDILDMSKIEANKFEITPTDFIFEKMLMRAVNVIAFRTDEKKQHLSVDIDENMPYSIVADPQRIAQVLANLLSNAVKFTPESGSISLSVRKEAESDGLCTIRMEVRDSGIGIAAENQTRLFKSFEQADGGISRQFGGTGLGLAISRSIVEMMGGRIWVESEEGNGATFIFTIQVQRGAITLQSQLSGAVDWRNLKILAVDDSPEVREYFRHLEKTLNLSCMVASDAEEACEIVAAQDKNEFGIIFVDWKMPGMDGVNLARKLKKEYGTNAAIVMISASNWQEIEKDARNSGIDDFIVKPLFTSQIVDSINKCVGVKMAETTPACACARFPGRRIMLVEDIEINREIVMALLESTEIIIECAENGLEACAMFQATPEAYDLIFMDVHMPRMDGYEASRRIRAMDTPRGKTVPIVAMTANVFREDIEKSLEAGMDNHISKPLDFENVIEILSKYLGCGPK